MGTISGLSLNFIMVFSCLIVFTPPARSDVLKLEGRALIVCDSINSMNRLQKITEAMGALPQRVDDCWKVSPPADVIILDQIAGFASIIYKNRIYKDWTNGPAWTPRKWLDGTGVTFAP